MSPAAAARKVLRCAIYIRVSTAMQRMEGWSLDAQRASLLAFAQAQGWKVVGVYADEGKSARKRLKDRKEIHRLLADVKAGEIDIILFKELDRWFRSVSDFYKVQDVLDACGVTWVSERQPNLSMKTKEDRLQVNLLLSVGQNEVDSTSDRIKYTNKYMRELRRWSCGPQNLPRGHALNTDQHVVIDPEQEPFVRALIRRFMETSSVRRALNETNAEFGTAMIYTNAKKLLRNPMLCGQYKEIPDFIEEPYLTREEFDRMQSLMRRNARESPSRFYIFSGLVVCADCGHVMVGAHTSNGYKDYLYYRCNRAKMQGDPFCRNKLNINERQMEHDLMGFVREAVGDRIAKVNAVKEDRQRKPRKSNRAAIEKKLDKLEDLYISSDRMTKERYEAKRAAILAQLIEDEPEEQLPDIADLEKIQGMFNRGVELLYRDFSPEERREFWRGILDRIEVRDGKIVSVDFVE